MEDTPTDPKEAPYCEVCNFPLSHCGYQDDDGEPELDCKVCQLRAARAEQTERADRLQAEVEELTLLRKSAEVSRKLNKETITRLTAALEDAKRDNYEVRRERDQAIELRNQRTAELDAVRKERDKIRADFVYVQVQRDQACAVLQGCELSKEDVTKSGLGEWVLIEQRHMARQRDAAQAKCAELEKLIQDAPHGECCGVFWEGIGKRRCDCWKSRLTPAPPGTKLRGDPNCKDCRGKGWIFKGHGEDEQCDCIFVDPPEPPVICWSCKKPLTEKLDLDLATVPNRGEPMCGACRGLHCD